MGSRIIQGAWTCIEEYRGIDLIAFSAHSSPSSGRVPGVHYPRVGYEVKVSRSDYRRELLRPHKRTRAVEWCNAFYFAVPRGLLTAEEIAFEEPEVGMEAFVRDACPESVPRGDWTLRAIRPASDPGPCHKGKREARLIGPLPENRSAYRPYVMYPCQTCDGKGYVEKSLVEREWPTLWIPRDVGLIEVDARGCHVTRKSPVRKEVPAVEAGFQIAELIRWVSVRPDPRHVAIAERQRETVTA